MRAADRNTCLTCFHSTHVAVREAKQHGQATRSHVEKTPAISGSERIQQNMDRSDRGAMRTGLVLRLLRGSQAGQLRVR